jgi:hypothetical protein
VPLLMGCAAIEATSHSGNLVAKPFKHSQVRELLAKPVAKKTIFKKGLEVAKLASAAAIALGINFVLDYASIFVHECGHAVAAKLLWGGPMHFEVFQREYGGMSRILRSHGGGTHFPPGEKSRLAILIVMLSGPLLGQIGLELQAMKIGEMVKKYDDTFENKDIVGKGFGQNCKAIYQSLKDALSNDSSSSISKKRYKALVFHFLNAFTALRATEQFLYGFTPLSRDLRNFGPQYANGASDGKVIWHQAFGIPLNFLQGLDIDSMKLALAALCIKEFAI